MHVLITSDTVGGVWTYTQELVTGLIQRGHRVTLVSFGKLPLPHQTDWLRTLPLLEYHPTEYRLEWMEVAERDIEESRRYLELLIREVQPDVLHLSQYCYGDVEVHIPRVLVAHSDIVSWWVAVHGHEPDPTPWMQRYREHVTKGLRAADMVIAPSAWMLDTVERYYVRPQQGSVIYNGRTPSLFDTQSEKETCALTVGRLWDEGKHISLLLERDHSLPVRIVGWQQEPGAADRPTPLLPRGVELLGAKSQTELRTLYAGASIYVGTSRYEPFGLSPVEAALSRCALVMNDNPPFHELWGDAALFFRHNDPDDLARVLSDLQSDPERRNDLAERAYRTACVKFNSPRMVSEYENAYQQVTSMARVA
jgi:glycosyltransferase involved in cell wall biosynthesis